MEQILTKIKDFRKKKGFSYENMATDLNITAGAYRKIEMNITKLTVERLYDIAKILEAKVENILDIKAEKYYKQEIKDNGVGQQGIENLYAENKERIDKIISLYEARLMDKDAIIEVLMKK